VSLFVSYVRHIFAAISCMDESCSNTSRQEAAWLGYVYHGRQSFGNRGHGTWL
jgi:hypothetical protein